MSRDIFVQDIPTAARSVSNIPDDWRPRPLSFDAADIIGAVRELAPSADFTDPAWGHVELPGIDIEVDLAGARLSEGFTLHVRASDRAGADLFIARLLDRLGVRAFDPEGSPHTGIFGNG